MKQHCEGMGMLSRLPSLLGMNPYALLGAGSFQLMRPMMKDMDRMIPPHAPIPPPNSTAGVALVNSSTR